MRIFFVPQSSGSGANEDPQFALGPPAAFGNSSTGAAPRRKEASVATAPFRAVPMTVRCPETAKSRACSGSASAVPCRRGRVR